MLRAEKGSPRDSAATDPPKSNKAMSGSKVYAAQGPGRRLWVRDLLVATVLAALYYFLATRITPPSDSPLSRSGPPVEAMKMGSLREVSLARRAAAAEGAEGAAAATTEGGGAEEPVVSPRDRIVSPRDRNATQPDLMQRKAGAVLGLFVADAAAMGLHWIYDVNQISRLVTDGAPEFHEPPAGPFYHYESGELSPYGYESLLVLKSAARVGGIDGPELQQDLFDGFKSYSGRLNRASKELVDHMTRGCTYPDCGSAAVDPHGVLKAAIVASVYAGMPEMEAKVREAVLAHQKGEVVMDAALDAARILEQVILHGTVANAIAWGLEEPGRLSPSGHSWLNKARHARHSPHTAAVKKFGQQCELPGSWESSFHAALSSQGLVEAVRKTIVAGGDNASRSGVLGALFGAQEGELGIPAEWKAKVNRYPEIEALVRQILSSPPAPEMGGGSNR